MSDLGKLDIGDWLSLAVISIGGGVTSAMAWFKSSNEKRDNAIGEIAQRMEDCEKILASHDKQLAVAQNCQKNIDEKLVDIKDDIQRSAERGAHSVNEQLAYVLTEVQKIVAHQQRRG